MIRHLLTRHGEPALLLIFALLVLPLRCARGAQPVERLDVSNSVNLAAEDYACPDCGCDLAGTGSRHGTRCARCCCGRDVCCPTAEEVTEERSCWKVSCEKVCVPAIRFPWQPGGSKLTLFSWLRPQHGKCHCSSGVERTEHGAACPASSGAGCLPKCGPVRCVSVLESENYEVKACRCKWEIRTIPGCCQGQCCAEGTQGEAASTSDDQPVDESDLPAPVPQP